MNSCRFPTVVLLAALHLALLVSSSGAEENPEVGSESSIASGEGDSSTPSTPAPELASSSAASEEIGPLEPWIPVTPSSRSSRRSRGTASSEPESSLSSSSQSSEEEVDEGGYYFPPSEVILPPTSGSSYSSVAPDDPLRPRPRERKVKLQKTELTRLLAAKKRQYARGRRFQRELRAKQSEDPRGEAEVRVCSVDLNGYGTKEEVKKTLKVKAKDWLAKERGVVSAIREQGCGIVAVQGIIGRSLSRAQEAVERLASKLGAPEDSAWSGFIGETRHSLAYNGFLYRGAEVEVLSKRFHADLYLPRFEEFVQKQFYRGPVELSVRVSGKGDAPSRVLVLTTMDFRDSIKSGVKEPERPRMQMAEALRQVHEMNEERVSEFNEPVFIVLGERAVPRAAPSARILEGAYRLAEFKKDAKCRLDPTEKLDCNDASHAPLRLVPLLSSSVERAVVVGQRQEDGTIRYQRKKRDPKQEASSRRMLARRTAEIFVSPFDLALFREDESQEGTLKVGYRAVPNELPQSPLVWAELNW